MNTHILPPNIEDFGPCCACGLSSPEVRNIIMLDKRLPAEALAAHANSAWGCFECGLPAEGASAVVCDACLESDAPIRFVVLGYLAYPEHRRIAIEQCPEPFLHDPAKHPPVINPMIDIRLVKAAESLSEMDHCPLCGQKLPEYPIHTLEVHNAWTIYGLNPDGTESEQKVAEFRRPQDWGHPRWTYKRYRLEYDEGGSRLITHAYCWTDLQRAPHQYHELFAPLIIQSLSPGRPGALCGDEYLDEDDFWEEAWGPMPPLFDEDDEDAFYEDDEDYESVDWME